jgi:hypothetical protein
VEQNHGLDAQEYIYVFIRKALKFSLSNNSNLQRWGKVESDSCGACGTQRQTQLHMLANCSVAATEGRYTWRHDSFLFTLLQFLSQLYFIWFKRKQRNKENISKQNTGHYNKIVKTDGEAFNSSRSK